MGLPGPRRTRLFAAAVTLLVGRAVAAQPPPELPARAWALLEPQTGTLLAAHHADERLPPASLTKLMTAYLLFGELRAGRLRLDERVTVSAQAAAQPGARMFLQAGETIPVEALIPGMLVQSGNDATRALVEHRYPDPRAFITDMNATASQLGLRNTHYTNASGLYNPDHYSSARDLVLLTAALRHDYPEYLHWFRLPAYRWAGITQPNRNLLLRDPGIDGMKTGHTRDAGYCIVASGRRNGLELIAAVLGTDSEERRAQAARSLLDYGFRHYQTRRLHTAGQALAEVRIVEGTVDRLAVGLTADLRLTLARTDFAGIHSAAVLPAYWHAPLTRGDTLGRLEVRSGDRLLAAAPLVALADVAPGNPVKRVLDRVRLWFESTGQAQAAP